MFGFFKKKITYVPPTQKQIAYAKKLGIIVTPAMSKYDVSEAIDKVLAANPKLLRQREHIKEKMQAKYYQECGPELIAAEKKWRELSEKVCYIIAAYEYRKETIVDVLLVEDAYIEGDKNRDVKLALASPKLIKDKIAGDYLEWDKSFELPLRKLLYYEPLYADFSLAGIEDYKKAVLKGLKIAKKTKRRELIHSIYNKFIIFRQGQENKTTKK